MGGYTACTFRGVVIMARKAVIIATDFGVEEPEIVSPRDALSSAGIDVTVASNSGTHIQTVSGDKDWASTIDVDMSLNEVNADDFDLVILPGGTVNADTLRINSDARRILTEFSSAGKPVGAICHAPWALIDAGLAESKTMTSYQSIRVDLENAGANWVDDEVVRCPGNGWVLITSRNPQDLPAFTKTLIEELSS